MGSKLGGGEPGGALGDFCFMGGWALAGLWLFDGGGSGLWYWRFEISKGGRGGGSWARCAEVRLELICLGELRCVFEQLWSSGYP